MSPSWASPTTNGASGSRRWWCRRTGLLRPRTSPRGSSRGCAPPRRPRPGRSAPAFPTTTPASCSGASSRRRCRPRRPSPDAMAPAATHGEGLLSDLRALGAARAEIVRFPGEPEGPRPAPGAVRIGVHAGGALPAVDPEAFDILLCSDPRAPRPWVGLAEDRLQPALGGLIDQVRRQPSACVTAAEVLRASLSLAWEEALAVESFAYSMLLASEGFRAWRASR